jgi:hypothetical protein
MFSRVVVEFQRLDVNDAATPGFRLKTDFVYTVGDSVLLLSRDIHHIEGEKLARHLWEGHVEMDLHSFTWRSLVSSCSSDKQTGIE